MITGGIGVAIGGGTGESMTGLISSRPKCSEPGIVGASVSLLRSEINVEIEMPRWE
jgi:hypothetical protein